MNGAAPGSLLRIADLTRDAVLDLLERAEWLRAHRCEWPSLPRAVVGLFFLQSSTRTRLGFAAAALRLGVGVADLLEARYAAGMTSAETPEDALRSVSGYFDAIVLRHADAGVLDRMAACARVPVINAGGGDQEHPTQALIDLFALRAAPGEPGGLRIGIVGDLAGSRAAHSLLRILAHFPPAVVRLIAPPERRLPASLRDLGYAVTEHDELRLDGLNAVYAAGLPEGTGEHRLPVEVRARYRLTPERIRALAPGGIVLCPLPRIDEIDPAVDHDPAARYFTQSQDGLFIRAAVLERVLGSESKPVGAQGGSMH